LCLIFRVIFPKQRCRRLRKIFNLDNSAQTLESFLFSGAEDLQNSRDKKYASQQVHRNLAEKLDSISPKMLDDTEEKFKVAENKLKELEDDMELFDNTWDNLLNQDNRNMVESFTDDFGCLSSETTKSKLSSAGNSEQPTYKIDIRDEATSTKMNNSLTPSVDTEPVFDKDWKPFHVSPGTSSQHQRLPKASQNVWPPLASTILSEDIEIHAQKHWWRVIKNCQQQTEIRPA